MEWIAIGPTVVSEMALVKGVDGVTALLEIDPKAIQDTRVSSQEILYDLFYWTVFSCVGA